MKVRPIKVKKLSGTLEALNLDKIHKVVDAACAGLTDVSPSQVEMNSGLQFYDGITTSDIQRILIKSASDLISLENPNYQYVAARLLLMALRKNVFNWRGGNEPPLTITEHIESCVSKGVYEDYTLVAYSSEELKEINSLIDHDRDYRFGYAALRQVIDKYLVQNMKTKVIHETPQFMYMMIAMTLFAGYPKETRMDYVKDYYDAISLHKINLPTPILSGVRTTKRHYSSCVLIDVDDSLDSIFASDVVMGQYTAARSGIGINVGKIRGINSDIRTGEVQHTGLIPFLKKFEATVNCCRQSSVRGGGATVHIPIWHQEIEDIIVLKNNKGTESNRVRKLDYSVQISKIFYERFIKDEDITLFSPHEVPLLIDNFGFNDEEFNKQYEIYEQNKEIYSKKVKARDLFSEILKERNETGRIYIQNIDHCNTHSSFETQLTMSNLCQEVVLPCSPVSNVCSKTDGAGEVALCILSALNLSGIKNLSEVEKLTDLIVRSLDSLIDYQDYLFEGARKSAEERRSIGVGFIGLAHFLAKLDVKYSDGSALEWVHRVSEFLQFYLLRASNILAKEKGSCVLYKETKYSKGILPIDTYKKTVDEFANFTLELPWEKLRHDIRTYGLRNSTLTAQMPSESSSVVANTTNGIEPPRALLSVKKSKKGVLRQIAPDHVKLKDKYELAWDIKDNDGYIKMVAVMQKFFDQAISANTYYNPANYEDNEIPMSLLAEDLLKAYKYGLKTLYYHNTFDGKVNEDQSQEQDDLMSRIEEYMSNVDDCGVCTI